MSLVNGERTYRRLCEQFYRADEKYNSGLFHFQEEKDRGEAPDSLTLDLHIDDKPLIEIIGNLYYPDCPYEFSVLPADILGQVYEQFLGKVIRLTAGHQAKVEDKPEVKKAGGVYYTPTYIVDYIVKNTVGKLVEGKTPKQIANIHVLDPACGSGSFLIGAYQYLLNWHRDWYVKDGTEKWAKGKNQALYQGQGGDWRLTTSERKRILLNNIYGVDIDSQAVEVTKLSLLLKVLEGENEQTISQQLKMFHERALPDLAHNIKCGNSLIGPDFYEGEQLSLMDADEKLRINAFDWKTEFKEIMDAGGFDAVIGNPPYVRQESLGHEFKEYVKNYYEVYANTADLYVYFFERSHRLLRRGGSFGMICSNKFLKTAYGVGLRQFLASNTTILQIVDFGELPVFENASTFPAIFITNNERTIKQSFSYAPVKRLTFPSLAGEVELCSKSLDSTALKGDTWMLSDAAVGKLIARLKELGTPLGQYVGSEIKYGIKTALDEAFVIDEETCRGLVRSDRKAGELMKPFLKGDDVRRYRIHDRKRFLILIPKGWTNVHMQGERNPWIWLSRTYPSVAAHLQPFAKRAEARVDKGDYWWELRACDYYDSFTIPKIVYPEIARERRFAYDEAGYFCNKTCFIVPKPDLYLLGLLNSKLIWFILRQLCSVLGDIDKGGRLLQQKIYVEQLPIRVVDNQSPGRGIRDQLVQLIEPMLKMHEELAEAKTDHERTAIQRQIDATDKQIDQLVYELYGLTEEEIGIVEGKELKKDV
jgi:hypothetical protein